ncbi:MAG: hypothetical protein AAF849_05455 [Bacteroidota bacterium]
METRIKIANPIYDVVFRYLMEDNEVAKLLLSTIIGEEIEELIFQPTSHSRKIGSGDSITVIRMDFSARIKQANGKEKLILIELQKAKFYYQTMRFRRYLGKQYQNPENKDKKENALPIYPIYILGDAFSEKKAPVIKVARNYIDLATEEIIQEKHPFIEALTHDAMVIQIPYLTDRRRTELERFLSIFDQSLQVDTKGHVLALNEEDYPNSYHTVIRRLNKALQSPDIEEDMDMEDEVINEFNKQAEIIQDIKEQVERAEREKEEAEQRAKEEKQRVKQLVQQLHALGQGVTQIAKVSGLEREEIQRILGK